MRSASMGASRGSYEFGLLRHPAVEVQAGLCYGRLDVPLQPGWQDAMPAIAARAALFGPACVVSSPSTRCLLPARYLADLLGVTVRIEPDLQELDFGDWEGRAWDAVLRPSLDLWAADPLGFAPPGGEFGAALLSRVHRAGARLLDDKQPALVVSHGGPLRLLPTILLGSKPDLMAPAPALGSLQTVSIPSIESREARKGALRRTIGALHKKPCRPR